MVVPLVLTGSSHYSDSTFLRSPIIMTIWGQVIIPTAHFPDHPLLGQPISLTTHYSDSPLLRQ